MTRGELWQVTPRVNAYADKHDQDSESWLRKGERLGFVRPCYSLSISMLATSALIQVNALTHCGNFGC